MPNYYVIYPVCGQVSVFVEDAANEEEAIELGYDLVSEGELEWDVMEHIVQGNVFHGSTNSINVEEE